MVNTRRGATTYESWDQAFPFQKHVQFGDSSPVPHLKLDGGPSDPLNSSHIPRSSMPYHNTKPIDKMFDVSQIASLLSESCNAATIVAEVSAAAAAQVSKEFCHMHNPKITKFKGGYSADAKLLFCSWHMGILSHIEDCELDNKVAIQLINDMTSKSAQREVEFQLELCGGNMSYQDLLKHLSIAFQGGKDEANLLAEFHSNSQKVKEMEEAFTDDLQLLARKVINKKPNFHLDLDATLKQRYASQLYDHNNASIDKTLLMQMPQMMFTQFHNELAQVLGTHQWAVTKGSSSKSVTTSSVDAQSREDCPQTKSQKKQNAKINAQSSHIKDLVPNWIKKWQKIPK